MSVMQPVANLKKEVKIAFNSSYKTYDHNADVQYRVGLSLIKQIPQESFAKVIDLGCGTGLITEKLLATIIYQEIHVCDFASNLLAIAKARLQNHHVIFHEYDFERAAYKNFDLVFANMSFQWSMDFCALLSNVFKNLSKNGILCFSMPIHGTFPELPEGSRNRFLEIEFIEASLRQIGYKILAISTENINVEFTSLLEALKSIKNSGASTITNGGKNTVIFGKKALKKPSSLSYNIGFCIAQKNYE
jgi:malonyl-ACP O-methyltransferase BioC